MMFNLKKRACFINYSKKKSQENSSIELTIKKKIRLNKILKEYSDETAIK